MKKVSLPIQTLFAELEQRASDGTFADTFDKSGSFIRRKRKNKYYWYFVKRHKKETYQIYVGPVTDKHITEKVKRFQELKDDYQERIKIVKALIHAGLPSTDYMSGRIVEALAEAGFFRLRGVLIGTTAYQCYSGNLGVYLDAPILRTQDADLAQFFAISQLLDDQMPPTLELLRGIDETFRPVPPQFGYGDSGAFVNARNYRVEFLTPNRGSNEYERNPAPMPALGGVKATPLRFLDFLIREPIRSVLLYEAGIPVTIPAPERYAVHKLILTERRHAQSQTKVNKDIAQATALVEALSEQRPRALAQVWIEAWERGPKWREALSAGVERLEPRIAEALKASVTRYAKRLKRDPEAIWPSEIAI